MQTHLLSARVDDGMYLLLGVVDHQPILIYIYRLLLHSVNEGIGYRHWDAAPEREETYSLEEYHSEL